MRSMFGLGFAMDNHRDLRLGATFRGWHVGRTIFKPVALVVMTMLIIRAASDDEFHCNATWLF